MSPDGIVLVDKPEGPTSHDIVAKVRRIFGTRKVGHAGTLDPMATGMLVIGIGRATRLLGHLTLSDKEYLATIRLGQTTNTDDAQGETLSFTDVSQVSEKEILSAVRDFRGPISQKPSIVSAVKVNGIRAYTLARKGEKVDLPARDVVVHDFEILSIERSDQLIDVNVRVVCSAGTYIRALARDLGNKLGVGGHLTQLRRTRSGKFSQMRTLSEIENSPSVIELPDVIKMNFPFVKISEDDVKRAKNGVRIPLPIELPRGLIGLFSNDDEVISLCENKNSELVPVVVFN